MSTPSTPISRPTARSRRQRRPGSSASIDLNAGACFQRPLFRNAQQTIKLSSLAGAHSRRTHCMTTLLLTHRASLDHLTPPGHPERPDRIRAVDQVLGETRFEKLVREQAPQGTLDQVTLCHDEHYVEELRRIAPSN